MFHCINWSRILILVILCAQARHSFAQEADGAAELVGVWAGKRHFGPELDGPLNLVRQDRGWMADIGGRSVPASFIGSTIGFSVPGNLGSFRGRLSRDGSTIAGHWIQPRNVANGTHFASPVTLQRKDVKHYAGEVVPLEDEMTMYLVVFAGEDGVIRAFLRNPERNLGSVVSIEELVRDGRNVSFLGRYPWSEEREAVLEGTYYAESEVLSILSPIANGTYDLQRVDDDSTSAFYPRPLNGGPPPYVQPVVQDDGWATSSLVESGIDTEQISRFVDVLSHLPTDSVSSPYIHALLIARHGKLVLEEYFHGYNRMMPHDTRSASKSVTSVLVGAAIESGFSLGTATPVYELLGSEEASPDLDSRKRGITVEHLLTMTSGLDCDDSAPESLGNEGTMQSQAVQPDWYRYFLELPVVNPPGMVARYCGGGANLLGAVLARSTGMELSEFLQTHVAAPLQISRYYLNLTPTGDPYMGGGIYWLPRDFLKFGQLLLDGGVWNGQRVLSEDWVRRSTTAHVEELYQQEYGYLWWMTSYPYGDGTTHGFYAGGNGGQNLIVLPELDLVVLFLGGNFNQAAGNTSRREFVPRYILPAVKSESDSPREPAS